LGEAFPQNVHADILLEHAHMKQISFLPGNTCFPTHVPNQYIRISFAALPAHELKQAIEQLCDIIQTLAQKYDEIERYPSF
jgi:DNA-binding transcriptional MocR family regulator